MKKEEEKEHVGGERGGEFEIRQQVFAICEKWYSSGQHHATERDVISSY